MPIWLHGEASERMRRMNHSKTSKCLQNTHEVQTVGQAETLAKNLDDPSHKTRRNCACRSCKEIRRTTTCLNPHACFARAKELLDLLPEKWDPRRIQPQDTENRPRRSPDRHSRRTPGVPVHAPCQAGSPARVDLSSPADLQTAAHADSR